MLEIGTLLQDRFLIEDRIGVGGMGAVYLATDQKFGSKVAIKQTIYDNPELAAAFQREARLLNSLHHPVLPHVSDYFSEAGALVLVMEYIEGEDLSEILKRGESPAVEDVVRWTFEVLDALDYLHSQDPPIIHRDIKPNNLKLTPRGNIVLLDFGLAKETSGSTLGMRSVFGYSRRYSPLEQIEGTGTDTRSDIFSLGATLFHLLTGEPPIDVLARASAIVAGRPDPLKLASEIDPAVPSEFAAIVKSALALNAEDRFISAAAMRSALEFAMGPDLVPADAAAPYTIASTPQVTATPETADFIPSPSIDAGPESAAGKVFDNEDRLSTPPAAAATAAAASAGRPDHRAKLSMSRLVPFLIAMVVLAASVIGFGIYRSSSSVEPAAAIDAAPTISPSVGDQSSAEVASDPDLTETPQHVVVSVPAASDAPPAIDRNTISEKPVRAQRASTVKRDEQVEVAERPAPERRRIVKPAPPRQTAPKQNRNAPVYTIESIFTGRPAGGRRNDISEEERMRRRQRRQMRREGILPPY